MANLNNCRVNVDLNNIFSGYKSTCKLFINENMKTIQDFQNHIAEIFKIEGKFYLESYNHYLPRKEDIRVVKEDDNIVVIPVHKTSSKWQEYSSKKRKKRKRDKSVENNEDLMNTEIIADDKSIVKGKNKSKHDSTQKNTFDNDTLELNSSTSKKSRKKNKKKRQKINENESDVHDIEQKLSTDFSVNVKVNSTQKNNSISSDKILVGEISKKESSKTSRIFKDYACINTMASDPYGELNTSSSIKDKNVPNNSKSKYVNELSTIATTYVLPVLAKNNSPKVKNFHRISNIRIVPQMPISTVPKIIKSIRVIDSWNSTKEDSIEHSNIKLNKSTPNYERNLKKQVCANKLNMPNENTPQSVPINGATICNNKSTESSDSETVEETLNKSVPLLIDKCVSNNVLSLSKNYSLPINGLMSCDTKSSDSSDGEIEEETFNTSKKTLINKSVANNDSNLSKNYIVENGELSKNHSNTIHSVSINEVTTCNNKSTESSDSETEEETFNKSTPPLINKSVASNDPNSLKNYVVGNGELSKNHSNTIHEMKTKGQTHLKKFSVGNMLDLLKSDFVEGNLKVKRKRTRVRSRKKKQKKFTDFLPQPKPISPLRCKLPTTNMETPPKHIRFANNSDSSDSEFTGNKTNDELTWVEESCINSNILNTKQCSDNQIQILENVIVTNTKNGFTQQINNDSTVTTNKDSKAKQIGGEISKLNDNLETQLCQEENDYIKFSESDDDHIIDLGAKLKANPEFEEDILKYPLMKNTRPKKDDIIAFKVLRISENYTPELSTYIIAKVINYNNATNIIDVVIIVNNNNTFGVPQGKFALEESEEEAESVKSFLWNVLIEPRLLHP